MKSNLTLTETQPMKTKAILRRALLSLGLFLLCFSSQAEGWLLFGNNSPTARVFERDPFTLQLSLVPTNGGKVEFLYAAVGSTDLNLFQTVTGKSPVSIMPVPGVFLGGTYRLTDIEPGAVVSAVVRGWTGSFSTWDEALNSGTAKVGISAIFLVDTTDPTEVPAPVPASILTSVPGQGFTGLILEVPEPSSLALAGFGAASWLLFRRRK